MGDSVRWVAGLVLLACAGCVAPARERAGVPATPPTAPPSTSSPSSPAASPSPSLSPSLTPSATAARAAEVTLRIARTRRGNDDGMLWTAQVPVLSGLSPAATARADAVLADAVDADVARALAADHGKGDTFDVTAELAAVDARYATVHLDRYGYAAGAAHGFGDVETFVFDRATGARLRLTSFFKPGTLNAALRAMSRVARERLPRILGEDGVLDVEGGTKPEAGRYQRLTPLPEGLEVMFGSYEVAP
jgi:hypothetical protein